ncbi:UNVERIFIED_CONTAM: Phosphopantothenoylcysteine decarboxylase [Sesamum radiatum]|uniref:phosphopantothenoylcysteine decarboxylase n=1 Tax=Sesamum radiatum TaxID=300843 RepID=A0AAW2M2Y4_SESRA
MSLFILMRMSGPVGIKLVIVSYTLSFENGLILMVIAPCRKHTGKIAGGLCDNLLTCIVRAWDYTKPMFVAPAMNTFMWTNPFTERHLMVIDDLGISLIPPVTKRLACGDYGNGAMAEPSLIYSTVRLFFENREQSSSGNI